MSKHKMKPKIEIKWWPVDRYLRVALPFSLLRI